MNTEIVSGLRALWKTVFADSDAFLDAFFTIAYSPDRCRFLEADGKIRSALYWFDCQLGSRRLAYLYAVATDPAYRGQGFASRLLRDTHSHLRAAGYAGAVLKPAEGLFPFYARLGYQTTGYIQRFSAQAGKTPAPIRTLSPKEYGALRRAMLPKDGVLQEGVTLDFLHTFARFYGSANALICTAADKSAVFEYLGDPDAAPGILAALEIPQAELPAPGQEIPFAMYHPFDDGASPGYLGITLE